MRVAVRRLRAVLRTARPMLDRAWSNDLRHELDLFGRLLGAVRDLDVLIERLTREATEVGAGTGETERLLRAVAVAARRGADAAPGGDGRRTLLRPARPPRGRNHIPPGDTNRSHGRAAREKGVQEAPRVREAHLPRRRPTAAQAADPRQARALRRRARSSALAALRQRDSSRPRRGSRTSSASTTTPSWRSASCDGSLGSWIRAASHSPQVVSPSARSNGSSRRDATCRSLEERRADEGRRRGRDDQPALKRRTRRTRPTRRSWRRSSAASL